MYVPEVKKVMSFSQAVEYAGQLDVVLVPYELAKGMGETREIIGKIKKDNLLESSLGRKVVLKKRK